LDRKRDPESWLLSEPIPAPYLGVFSVFTAPLNTLYQMDLNKNIPFSIENCYRVKVFSQIPGGRENNLKAKDERLKVDTPEPV
jgi:hypothetical protein